MILNTPNSRGLLANLFSDFIVQKIGLNFNSIIRVVDCKNFLLIKGATSSEEILDLNKSIEDFNEKYNLNYKVTHTIDLIDYKQELDPVETLFHTYHNSINPSYNNKQIDLYPSLSSDFEVYLEEINDSELLHISQFPYGYSLNQGRLLYYYGKHIFYNIPTSYPINSLNFKLTKTKNISNDFDFEVFDMNGQADETLKSAVLDFFDFNMSWLENEIKKVDWSVELTDPLSDYDFIKKVNKDFIIL